MQTMMLKAEVVALGWTLVHFVWQSTAIGVLYTLLDRCCSRCSVSVRYGIALCALALMPIVSMATLIEQEALVPRNHLVHRESAVSQVGIMHHVPIESLPVAVSLVSHSELWIAEHAGLILPALDGLWLFGVLLLALRAAGGWWKLQLLRRRSVVDVPGPLQAVFTGLIAQMQLGRHVAFRLSDEVISPMVFGIWRVVILLPLSAVAALPPEQLEAVLAHELAHVRRWDYLCNLLQTCVECLFFFQPAVWWISGRVREFREACCDEVASNACADRVVYAQALLQMEEQRAIHMRMAVALHGNGLPLLKRIQRVLGEESVEQKSMSGMRVLTIAAALSIILGAPHIANGLKAEHKQAAATRQSDAGLEKNRLVVSATTKPVQAVPRASTEAPVFSDLVVASQDAEAKSPLPQSEPAQPIERRETSSFGVSQPAAQQTNGTDYVTEMRNAGYPLDPDKDFHQIVALRTLGVTPEYALAMAHAGLGMPTLHDLLALKTLGVTLAYISSLQGTAAQPSSFHELITAKSLSLTPAYVVGLKANGIAPVDLHEAESMKAIGVTPEYASAMTELGVSGLTSHELLSLRAVGLTPENAKWLKSTFPNADNRIILQAASLHIDADFAAKAKANGFSADSLDRLMRLKISGLLD